MDSIRSPEAIKFEKIDNIIKDLKKELIVEEKKKMQELQNKFYKRMQ